jgi:hypothetical protein
MLLDLPAGRRDRLLFISQATVRALIILITTVSCSGPAADMPHPSVGIIELFSGGVTEAPKQQLVQRDEAQPKVRRGQPKTSASPKAATEDAPKATSRSVPRPASKKANTPPPLDAQREQQLYQEFLEWRSRQKNQP